MVLLTVFLFAALVVQSNRLAARITDRNDELGPRIAAELAENPGLRESLAERLGGELARELAADRNFVAQVALEVAERVAARLAGGQAGTTFSADVQALRSELEPVREPGRHGGRLTTPLYADPDSFNPVSARSMTAFWVMMHVTEPLYIKNPWTGRIQEVLAESHEVSDDLKTITVHLRPGIFWSDGEPFTADDVIFTFEAIAHPSVESYSKKIFEYPMEDGSIETVTMEKVDDLTVRFTQPLPYVAFLQKFTFKPIVPEHVLRPALECGEFNSTWSVDTDPRAIVGTGAFLLQGYRPGERVTLVRNPNHWRRDVNGAALPYLDELHLRIVRDPNQAHSAFLAGELDVLPRRYVVGERYALLATEAEARGFQLRDLGQQVAINYLVFHLDDRVDPRTDEPRVAAHRLAWFRDRRFRQAVAHAIDKQAMVDQCYDGLAVPTWSIYNAACVPFHNPRVTRLVFDPERSRALLDEMGLRDRDGDGWREDESGRRVSFTITWWKKSPAFPCLVRLVRDRMQDVGVEVRLNEVGERDHAAKIFSTHEWEVLFGQDTGGAVWPMGPDELLTSSAAYHLWNPRQEHPSSPWEARIDQLLLDASVEKSEALRLEWIFEIQDIIAQEAPLIPTVVPKSFAGVRNSVHNFLPAIVEPNDVHNAFEIWKEGD
ncbi:MAG: ABC transporter substrate-binding protein [Planctomycetes bacterium]|nr:ABC transporter substrate-binding protein [Planctomycetota bacterium]